MLTIRVTGLDRNVLIGFKQTAAKSAWRNFGHKRVLMWYYKNTMSFNTLQLTLEKSFRFTVQIKYVYR